MSDASPVAPLLPAPADFLRSVLVLTSNVGSRRSRPLSFWCRWLAEVYGRPFSYDEVRKALATTPGLRFGEGCDAATNAGAFATCHRALGLYPDRFVAVGPHRIECRRKVGAS